MGQNLSGGCACGSIRYETDADPIVALNCHCRDCQRAGGSAYAAVMLVPQGTVKLRGKPHYYKTIGDSGNAVERGFCSVCGSQVMMKIEHMPDVLGLQAASLDDPSLYNPAMDIFTTSAQHWNKMNPETKKFPKTPGLS
jgi:hypothetical protein